MSFLLARLAREADCLRQMGGFGGYDKRLLYTRVWSA
ncbi:MAG: hypothetical protein ACI87E_001758 [Mariniblastus sp.]|jgi:hypothetical protein